MKVLDIGSAKNKVTKERLESMLKTQLGKMEIIGIDKFSPEADIKLDIEKDKLPFAKNSIDIIYCAHTLEHLEFTSGVFFVLTEMHRVIKPGGKVIIKVPHYSAQGAHDFVHARFFNWKSMGFITGDEKKDYYLGVKFKLLKRKIIFGKYFKFFEWLFNKIPNIYDRHLCFYCPAHEIYFELTKEK